MKKRIAKKFEGPAKTTGTQRRTNANSILYGHQIDCIFYTWLVVCLPELL